MTTATIHAWETRPTAGHDVHGQSAVYDSETGRDVAIVYDGAAHGDLIAAAPELLYALRSLLSAEQDWASHDNETLGEILDAHNVFGIARAAIAKATGH